MKVIFSDGGKINQILSNLIYNAIKFTEEGHIEFGYKVKNDMLEFYVSDNGIGIKPEQHEKIFERFSQVIDPSSRALGGTGLGLAISKGLSELMGGTIWVESKTGVGSTFYFTVPYTPGSILLKSNNQAKSGYTRSVVLVVEDEEINIQLLEQMLKDLNVSVLVARNGEEAVSICLENNQINLVLMDIKMPKMNGDEATKLIKKKRKDLPVIAQTAYALENEIKKYEKLFDGYLTKPIEKDKLVSQVFKFLSEKR